MEWEVRAGGFAEIVGRVRAFERSCDCVIRVGGGKDSTWQRLRPVGRQRDLVPLEPEGALDGLADGGLVVDDQDAHGRSVRFEP
jgi:hypothetical protein